MARGPDWDEAAWQRFLRDPAGPVMRDLLPGIGREVAAGAKARYHRRTGDTADSIHYVVESDSQGPYCRVGGSYVITFLEKPAGQMHQPYRWLSDALWAAAGG